MELDRLSELQTLVDSAKEGYERKYKEYHQELADAYLCTMDNELRESLIRRNKSHTYFPYIRAKAEKLFVGLVTTYFTNPDIVAVSPNDPRDVKMSRAAVALQEAIKRDIYSGKLNIFTPLAAAFQNAAVSGTAILKAYWDAARNAPIIEYIKNRDGWADPVATSADNMQFFVHRMFITRIDAERLKKLSSFEKEFNIDSADTNNISDYNNSLPEKYQRLELYDVYERDGEGWTLSTLIGNTVVRDKYRLNDGMPVFVGRVMPQLVEPDEYDAAELYGASPIEALIPLQYAMNRLRNQQWDAISLQLSPRMLVASNSGVNPLDLHKGPGTVIPVSDISGVKELTAPNIGQSQYDVNQLDLEMQQTSGIMSNNPNSANSALDTATGISIVTQQNNVKESVLITSLNETAIEDLFTHITELYWKYGDDNFFEDVELPRTEELAVYIHADTGIGATNPAMKSQGLREAIQMFGQMGDAGAAKKLLKQLLPLIGITNTEDILNDESELAPGAQGNAPAEIAGGRRADASGGGGVPLPPQIGGLEELAGRYQTLAGGLN